MNAIAEHFADHRIGWSRAGLVILLLLVLFGSPPKVLLGWLAELSELLGYALLVAAALWRIWCLVFIGGSKNGQLAATGPYSVVRNPLYVGNFLGAVGFGFAVEQPHLGMLIALLFCVLYPRVVAKEEEKLAAQFGEQYRFYLNTVPRWLPDWSLYREPETVLASPRHIRKGILDAMWFLWAFAIWEFIEQLHSQQLLPTLF
jgi:protein-S-isoprenylcysteine O-methyltransferase Ste14